MILVDVDNERLAQLRMDEASGEEDATTIAGDMFDKVLRTTTWIDEVIAERGNNVRVELPLFGKPIILY